MATKKQAAARARFTRHAKTGKGKVGKAAKSTANPAKKTVPAKKAAAKAAPKNLTPAQVRLKLRVSRKLKARRKG